VGKAGSGERKTVIGCQHKAAFLRGTYLLQSGQLIFKKSANSPGHLGQPQ
jgi:hypothetical protein